MRDFTIIPPIVDGRLRLIGSRFFKVIIFSILLFTQQGQNLFAQANIATSPYNQDFNTLSNANPSSVVPTGWLFSESGTNANTLYVPGNGSSSTGDTYSFGVTGSTDRAFGGVLSGTLTPVVGAGFKNTTGKVINSITISYTGEQWRLGSAGDDDQLDFQYSVNATTLNNGTWTDQNELDFVSPVSSSPGQLNGNLVENRSVKTHTITGLTLANNATFYIRWLDLNVGGADDGLSVDDFSLAFTTLAVPDAGIFQSFAIMNFGGSDVFYDLNAATSNTDFNGVNLGTYNSSQSLFLDGAQNKTYKCSPTDITNGKLYYRVYLSSGAAGAFSAGTDLPYLSDDAGAGPGCQNQTWQEAAAGINLLNGLCDGLYTVEIYTSADYQGSGTGTLVANNGGANYKASFRVKNDDRSGIYQSQLVLNINNGGDNYYDLQANTPAFDFTGSLGSFCNSASLVVAGAENKTFKCSPNDITASALYYRVYSGAPSGAFVPVNLAFISDDGTSVCGGLNQTWRTTNNSTNILTGLTAGTYTLEVYTQDSYTSLGACPGINYANNGGANYKATFTVLAPVTFTTKPAATVSLSTGAGVCTAVANYNFVTAGASPVLTYNFTGATVGSGTGTGTGSTFNVGTTQVTVTGSNACSPSASYSFNVVVTDATAPSVLTKNVLVYLDASGSASITAAQVDNGSTDACGIASVTASPLSFDCSNILPVLSDLIISEYVEGSSNIKYLEIYNGTSAAISLGNYTLRNYANGSVSVSSSSNLPAGSLLPGATVVYKNSAATGYNGPATALSVMTFNGNDVVALYNNATGQFADVIGQIGFDPGTQWGSGNTSTADNTIRRKLSVTSGDANGSNAFVPSVEWDGFAIDDVSDLGSHGNTVTLTVTDNNGNVSIGKSTVTVLDNLAPVAPTLSTISGQCNATVTAPVAHDNCAGNVTGTTIDPTSYSTQGTYIVHWSFEDNYGNVATAQQTVVVDDTEAPVAPVLSAVSGQCNASVTAPIATDNCAGNVTGTTTNPTSYSTQGTYIIHWSFDDGNGNVATAEQTVVVDDTQAPVAPVLNTISGQCIASVSAPVATDNCVGNVTGTTNDPTTYSTQGTYTVHWSFDDGNGNVATAEQTVVVDDTETPVAPALNTVSGQCNASVTAPIATDNCVGNVTGTTTDPTTYSTQGTYIIHWSFDDGNGNVATAEQTVVVDDTQDPVAPVLNTVSGQCNASVTAPTAVDNCAGNVTGTTTDPTSYSTQGTYIVHWSFDDGNGNVATAEQTVVVDDTQAPVAPVLSNVTGQCNATVTAPTAADNCVGNVTGTTNDPLTYSTQGTFLVHWTFNDGNGNTSTAEQTVIVADVDAPVITSCVPSGANLAPNSLGCSAILPDYRAQILATDNCSSVTKTQSPAAGTALPVGTHTVTITATDAVGNASTCSFTVTVASSLAATSTTTNRQMYFGFALDQTSTITTAPTGGTAPYKIVYTSSRPLKCNISTTAGDETWVGGTGSLSNTGNVCPASGPGTNPVSTSVSIPAGGSYSITIKLMEDAIITATVTDAFGCVVSDSTKIWAEDVRCFAGNSGKAKVKICHRNNGNGCGEICVDESAVEAHLAHGDFLGTCTSNCVAPPVYTAANLGDDVDMVDAARSFSVDVAPNPSNAQFKLLVQGNLNEPVQIRIYDVLGNTVEKLSNLKANTTIMLGDRYKGGTYFAEIVQGKNRKVVKLLKMN